jgi:hypothetical protein
MRYFGYLTWYDLPNKDYENLNLAEKELYQSTLDNLRQMTTQHIRNFIGDDKFELDQNCTEYHMIYKFIANTSDIRIIMLEYNGYISKPIIIASEFISDHGDF